MKKVLTLTLMGVLLLQCGCSTVMGHYMQKHLNMTEIAKAEIHQRRTYNPFEVEGLESLTLKAAEGKELRVRLTAELDPLHVVPRDRNAIQALGDAAYKVLSVLGAVWFGSELLDVAKNPTVTTVKEPVIIRR